MVTERRSASGIVRFISGKTTEYGLKRNREIVLVDISSRHLYFARPSHNNAFYKKPMTRTRLFALSLFVIASALIPGPALADDYTPGAQHNYTHKSGDVPGDTYQYSVWVPKSYKNDRPYPVVFYLHGGGKGREHPNQGKRNMVSARLVDNQNWTDAGYSGNAKGQFGYIHVAPVKPIARWDAKKFKRLLDHVKGKVNIDENRVYVTGFSMGGQGTWIVGDGTKLGYKIAAMMPLGAWGCDEVARGKTAETCHTTKTPVWVQHCPLDDVSKISEQIPLFQNHLDCGGYGRFTMIPGRGHISRPRRNDDGAFSMRMAWMLSQTSGTPHNYTVQVDGGVILETETGERGFIGDTARYGFFEPGSVIRVTAPALKDGKTFVKWASASGSFANANARHAAFTTGKQDAQLTAIFATDSAKLTVGGGSASPANPEPGDIVTITANPKTQGANLFYWGTNASIDLPHPHQRKTTFCMPSRDVTLTAKSRRE